MKKLREWVRARVDAVILPAVRRCVTEVAEPVDYERLALQVSTLRGFSKEVSDALELDGEFVRRLAGEIDASDVAYHIDTDDVARAVEIDTAEIAGNVEVDAEDVAENLDYRRLAQALCRQFQAAG